MDLLLSSGYGALDQNDKRSCKSYISDMVFCAACRMEFFLTGNGDQALPFELQAFEVPLAAAVRMFESETNSLENKLLPSLERLTIKVPALTS